MDQNSFSSNSIPEPEEIKKNVLTSAEVICATSLDNDSSMPFGVCYRPKSVSGQEMLKSIQDIAMTLETCERCVKHQTSVNHIISSNTLPCISKCDACFHSQSVWAACKENGQVSHIPSLRACDRCLEEGVN